MSRQHSLLAQAVSHSDGLTVRLRPTLWDGTGGGGRCCLD